MCLYAFKTWFFHNIEWIPASDGYYHEDAAYEPATEWATRILRTLKLDHDSMNAQWMGRTNPTWKHFRSIKPYVSVFHLPGICEWLQTVKQPWEIVRTSEQLLFTSEPSKNAIVRKDVRLIKRILKGCGEESKTEPLLIPMENRIVGVGAAHLVSLYRDCGRKRFDRVRENIRESYAETIGKLFPPAVFQWSERIDDDQFESLVRNLLARDPQVSRIRKAGSSRERDGGRDMLADWLTGPLPGEVIPEGHPPFSLRRVVVQCKVFSRPVDKSKVTDIRDVVEHYESSGYFLVAFPSITSGLFDHLDKLRTGGKFWVDWWTRIELEERLLANPDILAAFSHLVRFGVT
jgi:hypothetical protein